MLLPLQMRAPTSTRPIPCAATSLPRATSSVATAGTARRTQLHKTALPKDVAVNTLMIECQAFNRTVEQFRKINRIENCFREASTCWFVIPEDASHGLGHIEVMLNYGIEVVTGDFHERLNRNTPASAHLVYFWYISRIGGGTARTST